VDLRDLISVIVVSGVLLTVAVALLLWHVSTWRQFLRGEIDGRDFDYRRRQYRRRMQTSAMLAILAVAILAGYLLTDWLRSGLFAVIFWCAVMLVACWVVLLALVDVWATRHHYGRLHYDCMLEQAKLQAELRHAQALRDKEKSGGDPMKLGQVPKRDDAEESS
jgi:hypothetical protein